MLHQLAPVTMLLMVGLHTTMACFGDANIGDSSGTDYSDSNAGGNTGGSEYGDNAGYEYEYRDGNNGVDNTGDTGDDYNDTPDAVTKPAEGVTGDLSDIERIGYCANPDLKKLIDDITDDMYENPQGAAVAIQEQAAAQFGGKFQAIVSECEFGYRNWYNNEICYTESNDKFVLVWQD